MFDSISFYGIRARTDIGARGHEFGHGAAAAARIGGGGRTDCRYAMQIFLDSRGGDCWEEIFVRF